MKMGKRLSGLLAMGLIFTLAGCSGVKKELTENSVSLTTVNEVCDSGSYVVVVEIKDGLDSLDYTLTENGQTIDTQKGVGEGLKEKVRDNRPDGEYKYVLAVKDGSDKTVTKELTVNVKKNSEEKIEKDAWSGESIDYKNDEVVSYKDKKYKCIQGHTSQTGWDPVSAVSLWKEIK